MRRILWFCGIMAAFTTHAVTASSSEERKSHLATSNGHTGSRPASSLRSAQVAKSVLYSAKVPQHPLDQRRISTPEMQVSTSPQQDISTDTLLDSDNAK